MPIQLDKILHDVAEEQVLHPSFPNPVKQNIEDAWQRVGAKNNLSVHEVRSIFKVLQKKYDQEKTKAHSGWKLFQIMDEIHKPDSAATDAAAMEEDEEYEMLEVHEDEEQQHGATHSSRETSDADTDSPAKSSTGNSSTESKSSTTAREEKHVLNTWHSPVPRSTPPISATATLQKKGISVKKANTKGGNNASTQQDKVQLRNGKPFLEIGKTIKLPDAIKRKLSEETYATQSKKANIGTHASSSVASKTPLTNPSPPLTIKPLAESPTTVTIKKEVEDIKEQNRSSESSTTDIASDGINLITIPANPTAALKVNGIAPRIENEFIFEGNDGLTSVSNGTTTGSTLKQNDVVKQEVSLDSGDNALPRTPLHPGNSHAQRYEALGMYLSNAMNRLYQESSRIAARLEMKILRDIIDAQSAALEEH